ncbi:restriction endonuclease subunit S [Achromobacter marplatensis]|uniref:restriction endonuclease subunit S n=1 Tax=Achromobacter marplatensis TaxID=470868 RepID=UPI0039F74240
MSCPPYLEYKSSGIDWLGSLPEHWSIGPLKRRYEVCLGKMLQTDSASETDLLKPYMRAANIKWSGVDITDVKSMWFSARDVQQLRLTENDLLVSEGGDVGRSALWLDEIPECYIQNSVNRIRAKGGDSTKFLYYWIATIKAKGYIDVLCNKSTIAHFTAEKVAAVPTPLPPSVEQSAIVQFLDRETAKIDALIAEQEKLIALLAEKRQATISHAVTKGLNSNAPMKDSGIAWLGEVPEHWKVGKAGYYISVLPGYAFPSAGFSLDEDGTRLLRGINVGVGELRWDEVVYWPNTEVDGLDTFSLREGDVVIGMDRPLISRGMRVALVRSEDLPCLLLQRVAKVQPGSKMEGRFIMRLLSSRAFEAHFAPETTGVSVPHISGEQICSFVVPVPPLGEQMAICRFLEAELENLDTLNHECEGAIALLKERRSALIAAAVTGQIDVRGTSKTTTKQEPALT